MSNVNGEVNEDRCPLCDSLNQCDVVSGDCWCFHKKVPHALLDQIPAALRGKACICQKCVDQFLHNQE